jgi:hypothetical protein
LLVAETERKWVLNARVRQAFWARGRRKYVIRRIVKHWKVRTNRRKWMAGMSQLKDSSVSLFSSRL